MQQKLFLKHIIIDTLHTALQTLLTSHSSEAYCNTFASFANITPFKPLKDKRKPSVFLTQQPSSPTLLKVFTSSPFLLLNLRAYTSRPRLCSFTLSYFSDFVSEHVTLPPFIIMLPALKVSFSDSLTKDCNLLRTRFLVLHSPCGEPMILFKILLKTSLPSAAYMYGLQGISHPLIAKTHWKPYSLCCLMPYSQNQS